VALTQIEQRMSVPRERLLLGGFSQGSMLACDVVLHSEQKPAGLMLLSSTLIARADWAPRMAGCRGLPVLQTHGRQDPLLPFGDAEELRNLVRGAGADMTFLAFDGGHELPPPVLDAVSRFIETHGGGM
jgi:phospholipase/carboxylesterase